MTFPQTQEARKGLQAKLRSLMEGHQFSKLEGGGSIPSGVAIFAARAL